MTETDAESLARKYGWEFGGDGAGFIFHQPTWGSWKAALSWSGTEDGTAPLGSRRAIYESRLACVEGEGLLHLAPFWQFQTESNAIEGLATCRPEEVLALADFVALDKIHVQHLSEYVRVVQPDATLRARPGLEAAVNGRKCYPGGKHLLLKLEQLLEAVNERKITPWEAHVLYERLHPFTDGNGRSGRALWLWMMREAPTGFLRTFYNQTLETHHDNEMFVRRGD